MYSSLRIFVYSGTGNTYRAAGTIAKTAAGLGVKSQAILLDTGVKPQEFKPDPKGLLGVMAPTIGGIQPPTFFRFILGLPRGNGMRAFVAATCAWSKIGPLIIPGFCGFGVYLAAFFLLLKGYRITGVTAFGFPHNWTTFIPPYWKRVEKKVVSDMDKKARIFTGVLFSGKRTFRRIPDLIIGIALLPIILMFLIIGHKFLAKTMLTNHRCSGCGLCARNCPKQALKMTAGKRKRPFWTYKCEQCMRCAGFCPQHAIEGSYPLMILYFAVYSLLGILPFKLVALAQLPGWLGTACSYIALLVFLLILFDVIYRLFHLINRIPSVCKILSYLTPTYYWRKYREPDGGRLPMVSEADSRVESNKP